MPEVATMLSSGDVFEPFPLQPQLSSESLAGRPRDYSISYDLETNAGMACRESHHTVEPGVSELDFEWDALFRHLEAVRSAGARRGDSPSKVDGDLSGLFTNSELVALNAQRETDYSMNDLSEAVQKMNMEKGTATTVDDVLERVRDMYLSE